MPLESGRWIMTDYSVLIQGPLDPISLSNLIYYKTIGPVVISYWEGDDESLLPDDPDLILIKRPLPSHRAYRQDTFDYQIWSIYHGLCKINTFYTIRTRSDEKYGNLQPMIDLFEINKQKVVCGNIFFKRWDEFSFHPGDHLFIGDSDLLRLAYMRLIDSSEKYVNAYCAEMSMAHAIMDAAGFDRTKEGFIELFSVADINLLRPFVAQFKHAGVSYIDEFKDPCAVTTIEEV